MERLPLPVRGSLELGNALWRHLAVELVHVAVVAALHRPQTLGIVVGALPWLFRVDDLLGGVLAEPLDAEGRQQRIAIRETDEEPQSSSLQRLVAQVLHQGGRNLIRVRPVGDLQIEHLQDAGAAQVQAEGLPGSLDESDDFPVFLRHVHERLLRQREQRGQRRAEEGPQARSRGRGFAQLDIGGAMHLFDACQVEQSGGPNLHAC